jgi:ribonuclease VapC
VSERIPERFVLDSSAIFTLFEAEEGLERVKQVVQNAVVLSPWTVLLEVYYITQQKQGDIVAQRRYTILTQLFDRILWEMNEPTLLMAARWKAQYRISFADAIIAACAFTNNAILLHKDPEYDALAGQLALESLPYKA